MGSGWTSGCVGCFDEIHDIEERLRNFQGYTRIEERDGEKFELHSIIQLDPKVSKLDEGISIISGTVFDEFINKPEDGVVREGNGYKLVPKEPFKDTRFGRFWITTRSIALGAKVDQKRFVFRVLSQAIAGVDNYVRPVRIDIKKLAEDYYGHWLGSIEREGRWQRGTLIGDTLEEDDLIGNDYKGFHKNQVGIFTEFFGQGPIKTRITRGGTVTVYTNLVGRKDEFIRFIRQEIMDYALNSVR